MYVDRRIETAKLAVMSAGKYLIDRFHKRHDTSTKEDNTVLLNEDIESENIIMDTIFKKFPSESFFTEESETKIESEYVWVIDPLCGSYSYLRGVETWSISLALISNDVYLLGAVYQPLLR